MDYQVSYGGLKLILCSYPHGHIFPNCRWDSCIPHSNSANIGKVGMTKRLVTMTTTSWSKGLPLWMQRGTLFNIQAKEIWVNRDHPEAVPVTPKKKKKRPTSNFNPRKGIKTTLYSQRMIAWMHISCREPWLGKEGLIPKLGWEQGETRMFTGEESSFLSVSTPSSVNDVAQREL